MKIRSHTHRSGENFRIARRIKSLCYAPQLAADLGSELRIDFKGVGR